MHPRQQSKRSTLAPIRKVQFRQWNIRFVLFFVILIAIGTIVTLTLNTRRSKTMVIKVHSSEERFVAEALQGIVLLPNKLAPTRSPALKLREKCARLHKCAPCKSKAVDTAGLAAKEALDHGDLLPKEIWPARRREWLEDEQLQKLRQDLASGDGSFRRNITLIRVTLPPRLPKFRNPCFMTEARQMTQCVSGPFKVWRRFADNYDKGAVLGENNRRLACLPYFIVTGGPQSGASELLYALSRHHDVIYPLPFQSDWLRSDRFDSNCTSVNTYLDYFDWSTQIIHSSAQDSGLRTMVAGEVAEHLLWDNHLWPALPGNEGQLEPRYTNADYLYHLDPSVKVIVILRNPTERERDLSPNGDNATE